MKGYAAIAGAAFGAAIVRALLGRFRRWKAYRNSLPDEERSQLFWNDGNYERLEHGINYSIWGVVVVLASALLWIVGLMQGWWCWPYRC